jgi:hypothetical protein
MIKKNREKAEHNTSQVLLHITWTQEDASTHRD